MDLVLYTICCVSEKSLKKVKKAVEMCIKLLYTIDRHRGSDPHKQKLGESK